MTQILGIETSCDETAAAVVVDGVEVRSNVIASQHDLHEAYGGVVPEIASRAHLERIGPVIDQALRLANTTFDQIDAVAVGNRPGLIGSLLVGTSAAKAIAWSLNKPLIGVDHIKAHLYAATMAPPPDTQEKITAGSNVNLSRPGATATRASSPDTFFPAIGLVVSGGHTSLFDLSSPTDTTLRGRTIDDAVGEAYDKAAVILDLGYPGGPALDRAAQAGDASVHQLPRSLLGPTSLDFSFSGLKTALLYKVRGKPTKRGSRAVFERSAQDLSIHERRHLAAAFQEAAIDAVITKLQRAIDLKRANGLPPRSLLIGGGVSANSLLRRRAAELGQAVGLTVCVPPMDLCLDNAGMIAGFAYEYLKQGQFDDLHLTTMARSAS